MSAADYVIAALLAVVLVIGVRAAIKHLKGQGSCCGGSSSKPRKKKLRGPVTGKAVLRISGMRCQSCANAVTEIINDFDGASARVNLRKQTAQVRFDREIDIAPIIEKLNSRGYKAETER